VRSGEETAGSPLVVFAQSADARVDIDAWNAHAERFFATRIGLASDKRSALSEPAARTDTVLFVVSPDSNVPPGVRSALVRPREPGDLTLAEAADERAGGTGLALLARRCQTVWLVSRKGDRDPLALRLASILASVLLGPILDVQSGELFGVKTARAKLDAMLK
jgi:hypothetical protein